MPHSPRPRAKRSRNSDAVVRERAGPRKSKTILPPSNIKVRSPHDNASSIECVTISAVKRHSFHKRRVKSKTNPAILGSSAAVCSSSSSTRQSASVAITKLTACRCPPDKSPIESCSRFSKPQTQRGDSVAEQPSFCVVDRKPQPAPSAAPRRQREVFFDRQRGASAGQRILKHAPHPSRATVRRNRRLLFVVDPDFAADEPVRKIDIAAQHAQQRRFARTVGADDGREFARFDLQIDAAQSRRFERPAGVKNNFEIFGANQSGRGFESPRAGGGRI